MHIVGFENVFFRFGNRENHDWGSLELLVRFDLRQNFVRLFSAVGN